MKAIEITVAPNGQTSVQTRGFAGATCRDASRFIEQALGRPAGEQLTSEFYQMQTTQQQARQRS